MIEFLNTLALFMLPFSLVGLVVISQILRKPPPPVDASNIINRIRLIWFAMTRQNKFVDLFPWLKNDEYDNMNDG